jgi:FkbM family methyltransferase
LLRAFREDVRLYSSLIKPGALCFDVGANVGEKSEAMLAAGARVVAFEPSRDALRELHARCDMYSRWCVVEAAVGSAGGLATLHAARDSGKSSLMHGWTVGDQRYHVPVITLDSAIAAFGVPEYCKIDVEGWEIEVLRGLSRPLPLLSFEFHLNERGIPQTIACLKRLVDLGSEARANLTPAEAAHFHFPSWLRLRELLDWFPGDLRQTLPGNSYGDLFIRFEN